MCPFSVPVTPCNYKLSCLNDIVFYHQYKYYIPQNSLKRVFRLIPNNVYFYQRGLFSHLCLKIS